MSGTLVDRLERFLDLRAFWAKNKRLPQPRIANGLHEARLSNWMYRVIRKDTVIYIPEVDAWVAWAKGPRDTPEPMELPEPGYAPRKGQRSQYVRRRGIPFAHREALKEFFQKHLRLPGTSKGSDLTERKLCGRIGHYTWSRDADPVIQSWRTGIIAWTEQNSLDDQLPERLVRAALLLRGLDSTQADKILALVHRLAFTEVEGVVNQKIS